MSSQFEFVNDLNKEFLDYFDDGNRSLCRKCMDYEDMAESAPDDCLRLVRTLNEDVMKYLYCFLFDKEWTGKFYDLLNNNRFKESVNNRTLINKSDLIRNTGNDQIHVDRGEPIDVFQEAQDAINNLKYVIENVHKIYNEGKPDQIKDVESIKCDIEINMEKNPNEGYDQLKVTLSNANFNIIESAANKELEYHWKIKGSRGGGVYKRNPYYRISDSDYGRTIELTVKHDCFASSKSHSFKIEGKTRIHKKDLPELYGNIVLKPIYGDKRGNPGLKAIIENSNAGDYFKYRWGYRKASGTFFPKKPYDKSIYWLKEEDDLDRELVCRVTHKDYSKALTSEFYHALKEEDFKYKLIGNLSVNRRPGTNTLEAVFTDTNIGDEIPQFSWKVGDGDYSEPDTGSKFELDNNCEGEIIVCKSTCLPNFVEEITSEPHKVERILKMEPEPMPDPIPEMVPTADPAIGPEPEAEAELIEEPEVISKPIESESKSEAGNRKPDTSEQNAEATPVVESIETSLLAKPVALSEDDLSLDFTKPDRIEAPKMDCFNTNVSRLQYFVAPRDAWFATNSLEYVDYNSFLNILLKEHGYERVIVVDYKGKSDNSSNYQIFAFDRLSQLSFLNPEPFERALRGSAIKEDAFKAFCDDMEKSLSEGGGDSIRAEIGLARRSKKKAHEPIPRYGKRLIGEIIPEEAANSMEPAPDGNDSNGAGSEIKETFASFVAKVVTEALSVKQNTLKTAIVLSVDVLAEDDDLSKSINKCLRNSTSGAGENILIITLDEFSDLARLYDIEYFRELENKIYTAEKNREESADPKARSTAIFEALSVVGDSTAGYRKNPRIMVADGRPGKDEIANLLLLMKRRFPDDYKDIPVSKVYSLAEYLYDNCDTTENTSEVFPKFMGDHPWHVSNLETFRNALKRAKVREELAVLAEKKLFSRHIIPFNGLGETYLERIYSKAGRVPYNDKYPELANETVSVFERDIISESEKEAIRTKAMEGLNKLVGLKIVKNTLRSTMLSQELRKDPAPGHYIFSGNPGTGKTVVARLTGEILRSRGLLRKGHVVEVSKVDLVSNHVGESAMKTRGKCEEALDGVLFIDEAYELVNTDENISDKFSSKFDEEAYTTLMKFMEDNRSRICVICAGYKDKMRKFQEANPGTKSRMKEIEFPDYSPEELFEILQKMLHEETDLIPTKEYLEASRSALEKMWEDRDEYFGNARDVRKYLDQSIENAAERIVDEKTARELIAEDIPEIYRADDLSSEDREKMQAEAWDKLDRMIGLNNVKSELKKTIELKHRSSGDKHAPGHYIFAGNPGTGKTVVARLVADILYTNGLLRTNHTEEVSAKDLIGEYVGQTANKTIEKCKNALDGVLFVDEAYELINYDGSGHSGKFASDYARDSYTAILKFMEDKKDRICVIFAGYEDYMDQFVKANDGMSSRITDVIKFEDYSDDELLQILKMYADSRSDFKVVVTGEYLDALKKKLPIIRNASGKEFGNARDIKKLLDDHVKNAIARIPEKERDLIIDAKSGKEIERINLLSVDIDGNIETVRKPLPEEKAYDGQLIDAAKLKYSDPYENPVIKSNYTNYCCSATVRILSEKGGSATAFLITPDGYAITCAHAVAEKNTLSDIAFKGVAYYHDYYTNDAQGNDIPIGYEVINVKKDLDMALIKLDVGSGMQLPYLGIATDERTIKMQEGCNLYGFPKGGAGIKSFHCEIASMEETRPNETGTIVFLDGLAFHGNSGGPVVSEEDGLVLGILRGARGAEDEMLNYMKPVKYFWKEFCKE